MVGEELAVPLELVTQHRLDGLWNEEFKRMLRSAILGQIDIDSDLENAFGREDEALLVRVANLLSHRL